jgi:hypothetical protein
MCPVPLFGVSETAPAFFVPPTYVYIEAQKPCKNLGPYIYRGYLFMAKYNPHPPPPIHAASSPIRLSDLWQQSTSIKEAASYQGESSREASGC